VVALSTQKAEFIACSDAVREAIWLKKLLDDIRQEPSLQIGPISIGCDNEGAIKMISTGIQKTKSRHIAVKEMHSHHEQQKGTIKFTHVGSKDNLADIMTKALPPITHTNLTRKLGLY
jgi:hypothetical protein